MVLLLADTTTAAAAYITCGSSRYHVGTCLVSVPVTLVTYCTYMMMSYLAVIYTYLLIIVKNFRSAGNAETKCAHTITRAEAEGQRMERGAYSSSIYALVAADNLNVSIGQRRVCVPPTYNP